jgi:hypothetical protein
MVHLSCLTALVLLFAAPAAAQHSAPPDTSPPSPERSIRREVARLILDETAAPRGAIQPAAKRNWVQRHPVRTAAIVGGMSGFAIGWAAGDDAVFDDFTGEFNGLLLGGICAGAGASIVAIVQAVRRP